MPRTNLEPASTSVLLIDGNHTDRAFYARELTRCSRGYLIQEATNGPSGLDLYRRSPRIDCVVTEIALPGPSGFSLLVELLQTPRIPTVAVILLTHLVYRGLWELAHQNGVEACLVKKYTSGEALDKAIQRAVARVGRLPKEDRHRPI